MLNRPPKPFPPLSLALAPAGLAFVLFGVGPALAGSYREGSSLPFLDSFIDWIGFTDLGGDHRNLFGFALLGFALVFGYFTNLALKQRGLGMFLNGVVGAAGVGLALHLVLPRLSLLHDASEQMRFNLAMIAAGAGAAPALLVATVAKGAAARLLNRGFVRLGRPPRPAPIQVEPEVEPRVATRKRI